MDGKTLTPQRTEFRRAILKFLMAAESAVTAFEALDESDKSHVSDLLSTGLLLTLARLTPGANTPELSLMN